jgi:hypothetical protein
VQSSHCEPHHFAIRGQVSPMSILY